MDRHAFLAAAALGGAALLTGCGSSAGAGSSAAPASSRRVRYPGDIADEPGALTISEWPGYEAAGTEAQTYGLTAGRSYTEQFGARGITYADIGNDDKNLNAMRAGQRFDVLHPCVSYARDYVDADLVQPFDPELLTNFSDLHPELTALGRIDGRQYLIPWDWGFASVMYRTDKVAPADATGWELFWNEKYRGRISMWDGGSTPLRVAGLLTDPPAANIDDQTPDELARSKQLLIEQKPLNRFLWTSEYGNMRPAFQTGEIWITYAWPSAYQAMRDELGADKVGYLDPSQGKLAWMCGFMMGKDTASPLHVHRYVDSFLERQACLNLVNLYSYGAANASIGPDDVKDAALAAELGLGDPSALDPPVHMEAWIPDRAAYQRAWEEVKAS
jgi:spermidine/putrescine transport system substrate-binding protein